MSSIMTARALLRSTRASQPSLVRRCSHLTSPHPLIPHSSYSLFQPSHLFLNSLSSSSSSFPRRFFSDLSTQPSSEESKEVGPTHADEIRHFLISLPSDLSEYADKFTSWSHLLNAPSRQLKALGLTIPHRKLLMKQRERYKTKLRRKEMIDLLTTQGPSLPSQDLQQALYDISFSHVYARQWKRAEEREARHWWRQSIVMNRLRKKWVRNEWNGVQPQTNPSSLKPLRNPEAMKVKLQEELAHLKDMQQRGVSDLIDQLDLIEDSQLMDELMQPLEEELMEGEVKRMKDDGELRDLVKELMLKEDAQKEGKSKETAVEAKGEDFLREEGQEEQVEVKDAEVESHEEPDIDELLADIDMDEEEEFLLGDKAEEGTEGDKQQASHELVADGSTGVTMEEQYNDFELDAEDHTEVEEGTRKELAADFDSAARDDEDELSMEGEEEDDEKSGAEYARAMSAIDANDASEREWQEREKEVILKELQSKPPSDDPIPPLDVNDPRVLKELVNRRVTRIIESRQMQPLVRMRVRKAIYEYDATEMFNRAKEEEAFEDAVANQEMDEQLDEEIEEEEEDEDEMEAMEQEEQGLEAEQDENVDEDEDEEDDDTIETVSREREDGTIMGLDEWVDTVLERYPDDNEADQLARLGVDAATLVTMDVMAKQFVTGEGQEFVTREVKPGEEEVVQPRHHQMIEGEEERAESDVKRRVDELEEWWESEQSGEKKVKDPRVDRLEEQQRTQKRLMTLFAMKKNKTPGL